MKNTSQSQEHNNSKQLEILENYQIDLLEKLKANPTNSILEKNN
ncbi:hypothetical protein NF27_GZ00100 [Candidatus Jidaibacter acanthamoeba]|uniref:Uncharacterized protein n=1 Tax=Candidatus Jidaibacter acanthamoebae TaxID=86105 RepID=A0A0C1QXB5_9RICK|nr:hypothetical protein [Candidatus Jidaibacter acanthamoeba]KIE04650.1 hypothetical protein NF27_GZ00100 [Candidatus Jidaibacter acanthamoeba]